MTVIGLRGRRRSLQRALIKVATEEAVSTVPGLAARAAVPERVDRTNQIGARRMLRTLRGAVCALVHIVAVDTIARVARWTLAAERACKVCAIVGVKAVVRVRGAFVDLRARGRGGRVAARTFARPADKMWCGIGAAGAVGGRAAIACQAATIAQRTAAARVRVVIGRACGKALAV